MIWASDEDWQLAVVLVDRNFCEHIEFDEAEVNGRKVLGGLGVAKTSDRNTGQRLIMNINVSNWAQNVIEGDMPQLLTSGGGVWVWRTKLWSGSGRTSSAVSMCSRSRNTEDG